MPWTVDNPPDVAKNWTDEEKEKCVKAANAVLKDGGTDEEAIYACIRAAGKTSAKKMDVVVCADRQLLVLGAPYGGTECEMGVCKDLHGDYFSEKTDFMVGIGDERPVVYYHGDYEKSPEVIGVATVAKKDTRGLWFDVKLGLCKYANKVWEAAGRGMAKASTGTIKHLIRKAKDGELLTWPIGELTLFDESFIRRPANQLAVVELKSLFDDAGLSMPEEFAEADSAAKADNIEIPIIVSAVVVALGLRYEQKSMED